MKVEYVTYLFISVFLLIIALAITTSKKKDFRIRINKLIDSLGGTHNILDYESTKSRFVVTLKDMSLVNKVSIEKMGAKGIVEIENQLKIILGSEAVQLKKYIRELKWLKSLFFLISWYNV